MAPSLPGSPVPELLVADALSTGHPTRTVAISGGQSHACALKSGGVLTCWGNNRYGQLDGPDGTFTTISTTCWTPPGASSPECWGISESGKLGPQGTFTAISTGQYHSCGIKTDGTVACWGRNYQGQSDAPDGTFTAISTGQYHSCGIKTDGTVACWGSNFQGRSDAPDGTFRAISAGRDLSCGIKTDGTVACWGSNQHRSCQQGADGWECTDVRSNQLDAPEGTFTALSVGGPSYAGHAQSCGIKTDGTVACWGNNDWGQSDAPGGTFTAVSAGNAHTCGIKSNGTIACWGAKFTYPAQGRFTHIAQSLYWIHSYAINADGGVEYVGLLW
ncbi:RCC1 domain-containing protein [Candidatus Poriferisodalis sp.]|uniref:RCC1 domain-containing protein n=1 Tax=Candidatus Poriferisodalis sp. TaxID=3101277 RepID=UPI003AF4BE6F